MLPSDYSDAYILAEKRITIAGQEADTETIAEHRNDY